MAVAAGQICAERFLHNSECYYVYQPTGVGDWYRWRLMNADAVYGSGDTTYFCLTGCCRGPVYSGTQKTPTQSDAASGFATASNWRGIAGIVTNALADYREFNVPEGMTHVRVFARSETTYGVIRCSAYAGTTLLENHDWSQPGLQCIFETAWYKLPTGTTKIRICKDANDSKYIFLGGVDWCAYGTVVDPDTAGSVMYYDPGSASSIVLVPGHWGSPLYPSPPSTELALFWADTGGAYGASKSVGGISHRGINTATLAWQTQTGTDAPAAWAPSQGDKLACDYLIMGITTAKVYQETACTNWRGTLTGKLLFDCTGCLIDQLVTVDQGTNMDVFQMYSVQCVIPSGPTHTFFHGDTQVRRLARANVAPGIKSPKVEAWGGAAATHYTIEQLEPDLDLAYQQRVSSDGFARWVWNEAASQYKLYMNYYDNTSTALDLDNGNAIGTRFAIRLRDRSLTQQTFRWRLL